jgi:hypothetical protein
MRTAWALAIHLKSKNQAFVWTRWRREVDSAFAKAGDPTSNPLDQLGDAHAKSPSVG